MADRASKDLNAGGGRATIALAAGYFLALILPFFVTLSITVLRTSFDFPSFLFLYLPPLLFVTVTSFRRTSRTTISRC